MCIYEENRQEILPEEEHLHSRCTWYDDDKGKRKIETEFCLSLATTTISSRCMCATKTFCSKTFIYSHGMCIGLTVSGHICI